MVETKSVIYNGNYVNPNKKPNELSYSEILEIFGWKPTQEFNRTGGKIKHTYQTWIRDTDMAHYDLYSKCEEEYEKAKSEIQVYDGFDIENLLTLAVLLLLLIVPGILYIVYRVVRKNHIMTDNKECERRMQEAINKARSIK